jgi:glycosyltransferase involved in cell wall biosynthesis
MKIGIDARWIFPHISGIGTYTQELIRGLAEVDRQNEYVLFFDDKARIQKIAEHVRLDRAPNFKTHLLSFGVFSPLGQIYLPKIIRTLGLDIFHSPNYMMPLMAFPRRRPGRTRCVVTIHDLIPLLFPQFTPRALKTRLYPIYKRLMVEVGARADAIVTVSETSRRDVIEHLGIPAARHGSVIAVPNGVASEYVPGERRRGTDKQILYVGRFDPYKNVAGVIDAFAKVRERSKTPVRLRIIGPADARYPEAPARARQLGVDSFIAWDGYISDEGLIKAYQHADVFVLLSLYEGFGLTVLEAMACGTPVVCSIRSSLPEVAGSAALMVDPGDPVQAADAIVRVLEDAKLAAELREKGVRQAAKFTWTRTATMTLKAYEHAASVECGT